MRTFLDTSAIVKRYIEEEGSTAVEDLCTEADFLGVSMLCLPETVSALCRLRRENVLSADIYRIAKDAFLADIADADVVDVTGRVVGVALSLLEHHALRAADAVHVASALVWEAETFVSADRQQLEVAQTAGLSIVSP